MVFRRLLPLLLAQPCFSFVPSIRRQKFHPHCATTSTNDVSSLLSPAEQIVQDVERLYADLDSANLSRQYSNTIQFSFVAPPSETHTKSWRCESQQEEARYDMASDSVFEEISASHESVSYTHLTLPTKA